MELRQERIEAPAGRALIRAFFDEIVPLYPTITPENPGPSATPEELSPPAGAFLVAYVENVAVACGGIKRLTDEAAELKRLYVMPEARKVGLARTLISALEATARRAGYRIIRLDTGNQQPAALQLFRSLGYEEIADYNGNPHATYWFEKVL